MIEQYDDKTIRCPRVGGEVTFRFCRYENNMLPCRFIGGCWQGQIAIEAFLEEYYTQDELNRIFTPPQPKVESLMGLMEKAKKAQESND